MSYWALWILYFVMLSGDLLVTLHVVLAGWQDKAEHATAGD